MRRIIRRTGRRSLRSGYLKWCAREGANLRQLLRRSCSHERVRDDVKHLVPIRITGSEGTR